MNETIKDKINDYIKEKPKEQELYEIVNKLLYNEDALKKYILDTEKRIKKLEDTNATLKLDVNNNNHYKEMFYNEERELKKLKNFLQMRVPLVLYDYEEEERKYISI